MYIRHQSYQILLLISSIWNYYLMGSLNSKASKFRISSSALGNQRWDSSAMNHILFSLFEYIILGSENFCCLIKWLMKKG